MFRTVWRVFEVLLMLLGVLALAVIAIRVQDASMRAVVDPPWSVRTLEDFRRWRPQYSEALRVEAGPSVYYLVHGERGRTLASGRSGYVFDERGVFVGWILDTGDDHYLRAVLDGEARRSALPVDRIPAVKTAP
jgi:hypothetical protein